MNAASPGVGLSIRAEGNPAMSGSVGDTGGPGVALVFTRSAGVWSQQGGSLTGTGASLPSSFYRQLCSTALSADGNTAILGANMDGGGYGAAWVFVRSGGVWTQQGSKFVPTDRINTPELGCSVSLSADGNVAMVGGFNNDG